MLEKFLKKCDFESLDDFKRNYKVIVPEVFNFAYDVPHYILYHFEYRNQE